MNQDLIGQTYVDERDSGTLVMKVVAVCSLVPTDVIVSPIGLDRSWQRNANTVRALITPKERRPHGQQEAPNHQMPGGANTTAPPDHRDPGALA